MPDPVTPIRLYLPQRPTPRPPAEEEGDSTEQFIHHEGNPAACQPQSQPDSQNIGKEDAHGPAGNNGNDHGEYHIPGAAQRVILDMVEGPADFHKNIDKQDGTCQSHDFRTVCKQAHQRSAEKENQGGAGGV